jgi:hypothetical protein
MTGMIVGMIACVLVACIAIVGDRVINRKLAGSSKSSIA